MKKIIIIASTNGSVLSKVIKNENIRKSIFMVVSDRECGAINIARTYDIDTKIFPSKNGSEFSEKLLNYFNDIHVDYFLSFYTKLFGDKFVNYFYLKVLNFHPSILPACPGLDGFGDTIKSGAKFIGTTLHFINSGIDMGQPLMQSIYPYNPNVSLEANRHNLFIQQCKIFIQFIEWVEQDRVKGSCILDAKYNFDEFIPNIESSLAKELTVNLEC